MIVVYVFLGIVGFCCTLLLILGFAHELFHRERERFVVFGDTAWYEPHDRKLNAGRN